LSFVAFAGHKPKRKGGFLVLIESKKQSSDEKKKKEREQKTEQRAGLCFCASKAAKTKHSIIIHWNDTCIQCGIVHGGTPKINTSHKYQYYFIKTKPKISRYSLNC
jgi:hypothetical protein